MLTECNKLNDSILPTSSFSPVSSLDHSTPVMVYQILPGGPCSASGMITEGDELLSVNGHSVLGKSLDEIGLMTWCVIILGCHSWDITRWEGETWPRECEQICFVKSRVASRQCECSRKSRSLP